MACFWTEPLDPERYRNPMEVARYFGGAVVELPRDRLIEKVVYFVRVAGFTFEFHSLAQVEQALAHFGRKIHPTSAWPGVTLEHYWQRWYERLPQWLFEEPKRVLVVAALSRALRRFQFQCRAVMPAGSVLGRHSRPYGACDTSGIRLVL